jgi:16S rRNA (guanine966-N2)-methyltransferase
LRIVSGRFRGRPIVAPPGQATRPTADRVRQALFDVITHAVWAPEIEGARVIDLFAGSGALGFEALSRGAALCLFVETDDAARGAIRENIDALDLFGETRVHRRDAADLGVRHSSAGGPFDLAFLDPPYRQGLGERAIAELLAGGWLAPDALIVFERAAEEPDLDLPGVALIDARTWGAAQVTFLKVG